MKYLKICTLLLVFTLLFCTACSTSRESRSSEKISTSSSVQQSDGMKKIGDTVTYGDYTGAQWEYTVQKVDIYDHYSKTGISESEFFEGLNNEKLIMIQVKIKKTEGVERKSDNDYDSLEYLSLVNRALQDAQKSDTKSPILPNLVYFSGHEDGTGAYQYWLDPGEEAVFQLGWCLSDGNYSGKETNLVFLTDTDGLALHIGSDLNQGEYIDLTTKE